jgi:hypothetical protein
LFKEERGAIIEAVEDLISDGVFPDNTEQLDTDKLRQLFYYYNSSWADDPNDLPRSQKSSDIQVSTYLFETYCCISLVKNEKDRKKLLKDHASLMEKLGSLGRLSTSDPPSHSLWKDYFSLITASNLTTEFLDACTREVFPKEILSIIISYDVMDDERLLEVGAQKLVYSRMSNFLESLQKDSNISQEKSLKKN